MANPDIFHNSAGGFDLLRFDIQVKASVTGTFLGSGQAKINFDPLMLSSTLSEWSFVNSPLINGSVSITDPNTGDLKNVTIFNSNFGAIGTNFFLVNWLLNPELSSYVPSSTFFNEVPTTWTTIIKIRAKITGSVSNVSAIGFIHEGMDNQQEYHTGVNTNSNYTVTYSDDLTKLYAGRIYANSMWTQVGGSLKWTSSVGTSVWDGTPTMPATGVSWASNLRIHSGAKLIIPATGQLTVEGNTEINTPSGLTIQSDATNTGSLITATASGTGSASVQRYMVANSWRIATSPVIGQSIVGFLSANATVATSTADANLRGMTDYIMASNTWSPSFDQTSVSGDIQVGKGYMLRASKEGAGPVSFTGTLNATATSVALATSGTGWNCIGNPFTSAITTEDLLDDNTGVFESGYKALYVYNGTSYDIVNSGEGAAIMQAGQGFFVKAASAMDLTFKTALKVHINGADLKSGTVESKIKLIATSDSKSASTLVKFIAGTTKGLDDGYDAGIFKSTSGLDLYTRLVEDNGIDFGLQCLPDNDLNTTIIPVGIDSKIGGEVVFSAELLNLPSDCKVILEDKSSKTFTDLSKDNYTTSVEANSSISDRFRLHTSYQTTGLKASELAANLSAYAVRNTEIRVKGQVSNQAVATLYDVQGRVIVVKNLEEGSLNMIPTPNIKTGIYMLYVKDNNKVQAFKIPVKE